MDLLGEIIDQLAAEQGGVVTRRQLMDRGATAWMVRRAGETGRLCVVRPGLMRAPGAPHDHHQRLWIAHLAAGHASVVSHGSAAWLWGLKAIAHSKPTVSVPHHKRPRAGDLAIVHRPRQLDAVDLTTCDSLPVTTAARTLVDLAAQCSPPRLRAALDAAHYDRKVPLAQVGETALRLGGPGWRGTAKLCGVLDERSPGDALSQSTLEDLLGQVLRGAGISRFTRQHPLPSRGEIDGFVDAFVDELDLIAEADGRRWHARQAALARDHERTFAAQQLGIITVRFLHEHLTTDMEGCIAGLRRIAEERRALVGARRATRAS